MRQSARNRVLFVDNTQQPIERNTLDQPAPLGPSNMGSPRRVADVHAVYERLPFGCAGSRPT